jgi:hypothetical protein
MPSATCVAALVRLGFVVAWRGKLVTTLRRDRAYVAVVSDCDLDEEALDTICEAAGVQREELDQAGAPLRLVRS